MLKAYFKIEYNNKDITKDVSKYVTSQKDWNTNSDLCVINESITRNCSTTIIAPEL